MDKSQAREIAEAVKALATSAAYHSDSIYEREDDLAEILLKVFPDES